MASTDRKTILLKAAYDILKKCDNGPGIKNALEETAFFDGVECDGFCLMQDIFDELGLEEE